METIESLCRHGYFILTFNLLMTAAWAHVVTFDSVAVCSRRRISGFDLQREQV